jgi:hypothetical protein
MDVEKLLRDAIEKHAVKEFRIWTCACGQKNRVSAVKVIALASQARCGRCKAVVLPPPPERR